MTDNSIHEEFQTDSQRYGNGTTIEETFSNQWHPLGEELEAALEDTAHLSEQEAFAFVQGRFGTSMVMSDDQLAEQFVQEQGSRACPSSRMLRRGLKRRSLTRSGFTN
jgi:hypothetical protein